MTPNERAGRFAIKALKSMPMQYDCARCFHRACESALTSFGFCVSREVSATRESSDRRGRIDLLAELAGGRVALELDNKRPRAGSLDKLRTFDAFRIIVLRGAGGIWRDDPVWRPPPEMRIDAIISLPVAPSL